MIKKNIQGIPTPEINSETFVAFPRSSYTSSKYERVIYVKHGSQGNKKADASLLELLSIVHAVTFDILTLNTASA